VTFWETFAAVARRWYVVAVVLALTAGAGWGVLHRPVRYESRSVLVFVPPATKERPNAYQSFRADLVPTAEITARAVSTPQVAAHLRAKGLSTRYTAVISNLGSEEQPLYTRPTVVVTATAASAATARRTTDEVTRLVRAEMLGRQRAVGVREQYLISVREAGAPVVRPLATRPKLALVAVGLLGLGIAVAAALASHRLPRPGRGRHARRLAFT